MSKLSKATKKFRKKLVKAVGGPKVVGAVTGGTVGFFTGGPLGAIIGAGMSANKEGTKILKSGIKGAVGGFAGGVVSGVIGRTGVGVLGQIGAKAGYAAKSAVVAIGGKVSSVAKTALYGTAAVASVKNLSDKSPAPYMVDDAMIDYPVVRSGEGGGYAMAGAGGENGFFESLFSETGQAAADIIKARTVSYLRSTEVGKELEAEATGQAISDLLRRYGLIIIVGVITLYIFLKRGK